MVKFFTGLLLALNPAIEVTQLNHQIKPNERAVLIFDLPDLNGLNVDGNTVPPNIVYYSPELEEGVSYFYNVKIPGREEITKVRLKKNDLVFILAPESLLNKPGPNSRRGLQIRQLFPDLKSEYCEYYVLNPPKTKVRRNNIVYKNDILEIFSSPEAGEDLIEILDESDHVLDKIRIPLSKGKRMIVSYSDLFSKLQRSRPLPTERLFLTPARPGQ